MKKTWKVRATKKGIKLKWAFKHHKTFRVYATE